MRGGGSLSWIGDTLAVGGWFSWTLFDRGGTAIGCQFFEEGGNEFITQVFPMLPLPDRAAVGELIPPYRDMGIDEALVVSRDQDVLRTIARRASPPAPISVPSPWSGGAPWLERPFTPTTLWSVAHNLSSIVVVDEVEPAAPGRDAVRVTRMSMEGDTLYSTRLAVPTLEVGPRRIDAWLDRRVAAMTRGTIRRDPALAREALVQAVTFPTYHPLVDSVVAGTDGSAWLRLPTEADSVTWIHLDESGKVMRSAQLPTWFKALHADASGLWGVGFQDPDRLTYLVFAVDAAAIPRRMLAVERVDSTRRTPGTGIPCRE